MESSQLTAWKFVVAISIGFFILQYVIYSQKMFIPDAVSTFEYREQYLSIMQNATTPAILSQRRRQSPPADSTTTQTVSPALSITMSQLIKVARKCTYRKPFQKYVNNLSYFQIDDIIRQVKVKNLTSVSAKQQFIHCAVYLLVRRKDASSDHVVLPGSFQKCKKMSFQRSGLPVALVSYPGSGNSWARVLLEEATGIYTGSVYCDHRYLWPGMIGEGVYTENVIVIKTHLSVKNTLSYSQKVIYIIRNPIKAIFADYTRILSKGNHTKEASPNHYGM